MSVSDGSIGIPRETQHHHHTPKHEESTQCIVFRHFTHVTSRSFDSQCSIQLRLQLCQVDQLSAWPTNLSSLHCTYRSQRLSLSAVMQRISKPISTPSPNSCLSSCFEEAPASSRRARLCICSARAAKLISDYHRIRSAFSSAHVLYFDKTKYVRLSFRSRVVTIYAHAVVVVHSTTRVFACPRLV